MLYQLSYTHRVPAGAHTVGTGPRIPEPRSRPTGSLPTATTRSGARVSTAGGGYAVPVTGGFASPAASSAANEPTTSSDALRACSPEGPGAGTNSVRR